MNIDWVIPCRYVEVHDNLATIIGGGIDTFWLTELPARIQVMVAIRLVGLAEEFGRGERHRTATRIKDPRGNVLSEMVGDFELEADSARPDFLSGVTLPAAVRFDVNQEGTYAIEFEFSDAWKSLPIHVVHASPPGTASELGDVCPTSSASKENAVTSTRPDGARR